MVKIVEYLHSKEIFHQDIKLDNFVLDKNLQIKLIDFGYSTEDNTKTFVTNGTEGYMPPEAFLNIKYKPSDQDIFGLGVCLFAMYTGNFPF